MLGRGNLVAPDKLDLVVDFPQRHVTTNRSKIGMDMDGAVLATYVDDLEAESTDTMAAYRARVTQVGLPCDVAVVFGVPFQIIIAPVRTKRVDLIVMGTHGRTGLRHVLLGSVAERVVQLAPCAAMSEGQRFFVRYCSACYGVHGRGDGPAAPALQPPPADLTRIAQRHEGRLPVAEMTASIDGRTVIPTHGSREMPVWGARFGRWPGVARPART
jgi:nucleotide-binding universal stress UspA family protein